MLLTEGGEGACLAVHLSLECTRGTESPTGAALPLVLHLGGGDEEGGRKDKEESEEGRGVGREDKEDMVNTFTNGAPPEM